MSRYLLEKGSFGIFPANLCKGLNAYDQLTLTWIWFHTNNDGTCFPSLATLSAESGIGRTRLKECVASLMQQGLLIKETRFKGNMQRSNLYRVVAFVSGGSPDDQRESRGDLRGVATRPEGGRHATTEPNPREPNPKNQRENARVRERKEETVEPKWETDESKMPF